MSKPKKPYAQLVYDAGRKAVVKNNPDLEPREWGDFDPSWRKGVIAMIKYIQTHPEEEAQ